MKKFIFIFGLLISFSSYANTKNSTSVWEGVWEYERYATAKSGTLEITDCRDDLCNFNIATANGTHTCLIEGEFTTNANSGEYKEKAQTFYDQYEDIIISFNLNTDKQIITITANGPIYKYCGTQGHFIGEYENKNNPLRYDTGFNCWTKDLTDSETAICASQKLATASKEMFKNYSFLQTKEWFRTRNKCHKDLKCLWNFYISSIRTGYEQKQGKSVNFYEYMGNLDDDIYYPTDFSLLTDFFEKNMQKDDYNQWTLNFSQMSTSKCDKCHYAQYGIAGLYTITESAFYINKDEIWLAFLYHNYESNDKYIVIYAPSGKEEKNIPAEFDDWLIRIKEHFSNQIKLKHFDNIKQ